MPESRQSRLVDPISHLAVDVIGLGMHGSWTALAVSRLRVARLRLWDDDTVSEENLDTQVYTADQVGQPKSTALANVLLTHGYQGELELRPKLDALHAEEGAHEVVVCCADDMVVRQDAAEWARASGSRYYIESRSMAHTVLMHGFQPTLENVDRYWSDYFPEDVVTAECGLTGTAAVGMRVASDVCGLITLTRGGEVAIDRQHEILLGMSHLGKPL